MSIRVIEIGGKGVRRADVEGKKIDIVVVPQNQLYCLERLVEFATQNLPIETKAVAFSSAGVIEAYDLIVNSPNVHWLDGERLASTVTKYCGQPAFVFNDMETAVTGMAELFPELSFFLGATWSSGIGERLYRKGFGIVSASEGGHTMVDFSPYARLCGCGMRGCIEAVAGGLSTIQRVVMETQTLGIVVSGNPCSFLDRAYQSGDKWAREVYGGIAVAMGVHLATILQFNLDLQAVVWKGTFAQHALRLPGIEQAIRASMRNHLMNHSWEAKLTFRLVPEPPEAIEDAESFIGAATLATNLLNL